MNRETLKEMFNFTKNKKKTIVLGIVIMIELLIYTFSYPFIMQRVVDEAIPQENIHLVIFLSCVFIFLLPFYCFTYRERISLITLTARYIPSAVSCSYGPWYACPPVLPQTGGSSSLPFRFSGSSLPFRSSAFHMIPL